MCFWGRSCKADPSAVADRFATALPRLAALAAQALGWAPDTFWNATPADLALALGSAEPAGEGMDRAQLSLLMEADNG